MSAEEQVAKRFVGDVAEHELTIFKDDGVYRHLRCMKPGTYAYGFDVLTWPGYLAIVGDAGDFIFSRIRDMFEFFESHNGRINPHYWSQKLQAPRMDAATVYSHDALRAAVLEWARQQAESDVWDYGCEMVYPSLLIEALEREVLFGYTHYREEGRERLQLLEENAGNVETWEWDVRDYDHQFIWCCHAIVWAIKHYREVTTTVTGSEAA